MTSRPEVTKGPDVFNALEAGIYLGINVGSPDRVVERLCRKGELRGRKPSRKQGWRIHRQACDDYLLLSGGKR